MYFNKNANLSHYLVIKIEEFYNQELFEEEKEQEFVKDIIEKHYKKVKNQEKTFRVFEYYLESITSNSFINSIL